MKIKALDYIEHESGTYSGGKMHDIPEALAKEFIKANKARLYTKQDEEADTKKFQDREKGIKASVDATKAAREAEIKAEEALGEAKKAFKRALAATEIDDKAAETAAAELTEATEAQTLAADVLTKAETEAAGKPSQALEAAKKAKKDADNVQDKAMKADQTAKTKAADSKALLEKAKTDLDAAHKNKGGK